MNPSILAFVIVIVFFLILLIFLTFVEGTLNWYIIPVLFFFSIFLAAIVAKRYNFFSRDTKE